MDVSTEDGKKAAVFGRSGKGRPEQALKDQPATQLEGIFIISSSAYRKLELLVWRNSRF